MNCEYCKEEHDGSYGAGRNVGKGDEEVDTGWRGIQKEKYGNYNK